MAVTLFRFNSIPDPISIAVQTWLSFSEFKYSEKVSGYYWNTAGELPVLQYKHFVLPKYSILHFLRSTFDLDEDLSQSEKEESRMIQEMCIAELEPAIQHALWTEENVSKEFFTAHGSFWEKLFCGPSNKINFTFEKNRITEHLRKDCGLETPENALAMCKRVHKTFSVILGDKNFFFSNCERAEYPRAADVVVYSFLKYQLQVLSDHIQVKQSLLSFPNLMTLIERVESALQLKVKAGIISPPFPLLSTQQDSQEFYCPKIYESPLESTNQELVPIIYKCPGDLPTIRKHTEANLSTRVYITGVSLSLFFFFYLKS